MVEPRAPPQNFGTLFGQFWNSLYVNRGFNSSFVLLLPLFTVTIPGYGRGLQNQTPLSALNVGNLSVFGIILFGSIALWAPILFPNLYRPEDGLSTRQFPPLESIPNFLGKRLLELTEHIVGRVLEVDDKELKAENFILSRLHLLIDFIMSFGDKLLDQIPVHDGLHPQECIKRCICESYKSQHRFGSIGRIIRFLFRPYKNSVQTLKQKSRYRLAATYGLKDKSVECYQRFNKCDFNLVHLAHNVLQFLF